MTHLQSVVPATQAMLVDKHFSRLVRGWVAAMVDKDAELTRAAMDSIRLIAETIPSFAASHSCNEELTNRIIDRIADAMVDLTLKTNQILGDVGEKLGPYASAGIPVAVKVDVLYPKTTPQITQLAKWALDTAVAADKTHPS